MKTIFLLTLISLLFSCNQETASDDEDLSEIIKENYMTDNTEIIGSWTMCAVSENGMMTQVNICPTVSFLNNGSGFVGNLSTPLEHFSWSLKKGALNIYYKDTISNSTFSDTFYKAIISKQNNRLNLIINQPKKSNTFYLSK